MAIVDLAANSLRSFSFRGKGRLLNGLCPKTGTRRTTLFGYTIDLSLEDYIQRNVYLGNYEPHESAVVRAYLEPGMTFLDVGANIGYYSLMASAAAGPSGRVLSLEPNPELYNHFQKTIRNNEIRNITLQQAAVGDQAGWADLFVPKLAGNNTPTMIANEGGRPVRVPVITLDEFLDQQRVDRVDFLKIDVEGFEPKVIQGARSAIQAKKIRAVLCEFNGHWLRKSGTTPKELYALFQSLGLRSSIDPGEQGPEDQNVLFLAA